MQPNEIIIERQFAFLDRGRCVEDVIDRPENVRAISGMRWQHERI
jgi:hypothetical protein